MKVMLHYFEECLNINYQYLIALYSEKKERKNNVKTRTNLGREEKQCEKKKGDRNKNHAKKVVTKVSQVTNTVE